MLTDLVSSAGPEQLKEEPRDPPSRSQEKPYLFYRASNWEKPLSNYLFLGSVHCPYKDLQRISLGPIEVNVATHYDRILN